MRHPHTVAQLYRVPHVIFTTLIQLPMADLKIKMSDFFFNMVPQPPQPSLVSSVTIVGNRT
jgi:hypothetical protein